MPIKVRTGCGTCKKRKLKCDETKPTCLRCIRAKLFCAGYQIAPTARPYIAAAESVDAVSDLRPEDNTTFQLRLSRFVDFDRADSAAYDFCRQYTVREISSGRPFWTSTVLASAEHDPAILHALLALASVQRSKLDEVTGIQNQISSLMLNPGPTNKHYYKAVHLLRRRLEQKDKYSQIPVLIACLVLLSCDLVQSRYGEAFVHLQNGRRLLREMHNQGADSIESPFPLALKPSSIDRSHELAYEFALLDLQSANFGDLSSHFLLNDGSTDRNDLKIPTMFTNLDDAWRYLVIVHNSLNHLVRMCSEDIIGRDDGSPQSFRAVHEQIRLESWLRSWKIAFHNSALRPLVVPSAAITTSFQKQYASCLLRYTYLAVFTRTLLNIGDEMAFDHLLPEFAKIISLCEELCLTQPTVSIDTGVVQPLFILGCSCRHPDLRRRCIQVLSRAGVEGHWDSRLVRLLTKYRMETEEEEAGYVHHPNVQFPKDAALLSATIPVHARYTRAIALFQDTNYTQVEIQLQRRRLDANSSTPPSEAFEVKRKMFVWPPID